MKLAIVLPSFQHSIEKARSAMIAANEAGLDGCFCYDHLWPLGAPGRPAIAPFPLLGSLASASGAMAIGPLVARVGLVADALLERELLGLRALVGERLIAGLGTGDAKSAVENRAYGIAVTPASTRRRQLFELARRLGGQGITTWIGGGSARTNDLVLEAGAVLNLWAAPPEKVRALAARGEITWGGTLPRQEGEAAALLGELADAGASWAVFGWPGSVEAILSAARAAGVR